jgi:hypothetical protein
MSVSVEKVTMQSPDGEETREVVATEAELVPLMVQGWKQIQTAKPAVPAAKHPAVPVEEK